VAGDLEKARADYLKGDYVSAKSELQRVLALKKDSAESHLLLGMISWQEQKIDEAIKSVSTAIQYQSNYPEAFYVLGKLYFENRNWKKAEEAANSAISQGGKFANLYALLGDSLLLQFKADEAEMAYEQSLKSPSPKSDVTEDLKERLAAIKIGAEFKAHKNDPNYIRPNHIIDRRIKPSGAGGKVKIAGILTEKGEFKPFAIVSIDATAGKEEGLIKALLAYRFTPATIKGKPVSFWFVIGYENSSEINVMGRRP
jgi:tetratricopeptide (TPR) repeat protein